MQTITQSFSLLWHALFLDEDAYATMRDYARPVQRGLVILLLLGLAVGIAGVIGVTLEWASSPSLSAIREAVTAQIQATPWWPLLESNFQALQSFMQMWDTMWNIMGFAFPTPVSSLSGLIAKPLGLIISWLIFGLLAHLFARMFGGSGSLGETLGATSLAAAPQLLLLLTVLPFVAVAGIAAWTLLCRYMAIRVTHKLSWGRSLWSVLLPQLVIGIFVFLLALLLGIVMGLIVAGGN